MGRKKRISISATVFGAFSIPCLSFHRWFGGRMLGKVNKSSGWKRKQRIWHFHSFRSIWFALIALSAFCVVFLSCIISLRYNANYLTTVTDNTHHTVADVPFPAVTLCHYNRIDLRKVDAAIDRLVHLTSITSVHQFQMSTALKISTEFLPFRAKIVTCRPPTIECTSLRFFW